MTSVANKEKGISRRQFFKGSAAGGVAGLVVGAGGTALLTAGMSKPWLPKKWNYETDVLVVGTGYAGQNAAIASHDAGADVLMLEKAPEQFAGGNSSVSGGGLTIPTGVTESIPYYRSLCFGTVPDDLPPIVAEALFNVPEQLKKLGIELRVTRSYARTPSSPPPTGLRRLPGAEHGQIHTIVPPKELEGVKAGAGHIMYLALKNLIINRGISIHYETPVKELIQDPISKEIMGAVAEEAGKEIYVKAKKGVVLACGGYEANPEMMSYFNYPGIKIYPWGTPYNTGDGIKMASEVGAPLWHTFSIEWAGHSVKVPSELHGVSIQASVGRTAGYIYVNKYGKRFIDELTGMVHNKESLAFTHFSHDMVEYPNMPFYTIFDEAGKSSGPLGRRGGMTWNGVHGVYEWSSDNNAEIEKGWILKGDTLKDLATKMGIDPNGLQESVAKYNEICRRKKDSEFGRQERSLVAINKPPFYGMELALTCINTQGGPKHNGKAQTLDKDDKPIPRLYTPGELGSFFGFLYPGGSNIPEAMAFGRIAGENAAAETPWS